MRIAEFNVPAGMNKSEVAKQLGVSRAYVTMLAQDKGAVAQLGERLPCTEEVRGSSPLSSTTKNVELYGGPIPTNRHRAPLHSLTSLVS
jgi:hypothetical protein